MTALVQHVREVLARIEFLDYQFTAKEGHGGVYLQATYVDGDTYTGSPELQATRKWLISPLATDSEIVQTAFKACATSMEHRTREGFMYRGARIFGPHFDCEDLARLCQSGRERSGARVAADASLTGGAR